MTLEEAKAHTSFAVIPAKAGIQWYLRGARLDFGSALRAVRDDIKRRSGPSGMTSKARDGYSFFAVIPAEAGIQGSCPGLPHFRRCQECRDTGHATQD